MRRREFLSVLGGAAAAWPLTARAQLAVPGQQAERVRRVGVLMAHAAMDKEFHEYLNAFRNGLRELGWVEGRNVQFDIRWGALDDPAVRTQLSDQLIALKPDVILTQNTPPTGSMLQQTRSIPVVFVVVTDPVGSGYVESLARPGRNATGFTIMEPMMAGKWLELLKEIAPDTKRAAFLFNPETAPYVRYYLDPFNAAAKILGLETISTPVHDKSALQTAIATQSRQPNSGLVIIPDGFLNVQREEIVSLTARYRVPAVYPWRFFPESGGLLSYGSRHSDQFRLGATYVSRILRGEKPGELPVQAPTKFELVINVRTAKALGLHVPPTLLARADEVIE
jgi:putative ABC transport system substrate-binding protein